MIAFATIDDLISGWRTLDDGELEQATTLIERASAQLLTLMQRAGIMVDVCDEIQKTNLCTVTCNMVRRVMDSLPGGVQSASQGIGAVNASFTFSNPDNSLYLTKSDREILGLVSKSRYRGAQAQTWRDEVDNTGFPEGMCVTPEMLGWR